MEEIKKAYDEVLSVLKKHRTTCVFDVDQLETKANIHLFGLELRHKHGLNVDPVQVNSIDWFRIGEYRTIGWWGPKYNRTISWSVDGKQPKDELLFCISFSTGAYIFGEDYPIELFQKFWLELKSFKPDYTDETNKGLYWKISNSKDAFNSFDELLKKYYDLNKEDAKKRNILKLEKEIECLKQN